MDVLAAPLALECPPVLARSAEIVALFVIADAATALTKLMSMDLIECQYSAQQNDSLHTHCYIMIFTVVYFDFVVIRALVVNPMFKESAEVVYTVCYMIHTIIHCKNADPAVTASRFASLEDVKVIEGSDPTSPFLSVVLKLL